MSSDSSFVDILKTLIRNPCVVGAEHSFFRVLQRELEERGAEVTWYEGLLVAHGSNPDSIMFSAHIDRHGLICTGPNEFQYAAFITGARSDLLGNSVSEDLMQRIADRFDGLPVYAYEPWSGSYCGTGRVKDTYICKYRNNLIFEVEGLNGLVAGTPVAFRDNLRQADGYFSGQLDNILTVATLVDLFDHGFQGTAFFTAQEEAGKSWRYLLEWFRRFGNTTNKLIVLDTSPFPDSESAEAQDVVLRTKDANAAFNLQLSKHLESQCQELGIRYILKDQFIDAVNQEKTVRGDKPLLLGSTEMGRIIATSNGLVDGTTLQVPTTGYHTMEETASVAACESFQRLLLSVAEVAELETDNSYSESVTRTSGLS